MELKHLITFSTLAETLSFTKTGELLYLSHSTVSKHLTVLEKELGVQLIKRDTHFVRLTEEGMVFMARISPALRMLNEAQSEVTAFQKSEDYAQFRIGIDQMLQDGANLLGQTLRGIFALKKELPRLNIQILSLDRDEISNAVQDGNIDIGIMVCDLGIKFESSVIERRSISVDTQLLVMPKVDGLRYELDNIGELSTFFKTAYIGSKKQVYPSAIPIFSALGIQPAIELIDSFSAVLYNVISHNGMTICPKCFFDELKLDNLVGIELTPSVCIAGCYRKDSVCPYIQPLLNIYDHDWA